MKQGCVVDSTKRGDSETPSRSSDRSDLAIAEMLTDPSASAGGLATELHMMAGAVIDENGTAAFCDAAGKVLYKPVADWIGFMAQRLWFQARQEMARQLGAPDLSDEARAALQANLRRELRLDALQVLSWRSGAAYEEAIAGNGYDFTIPIRVKIYGEVISPELLRAIEDHREARQLYLHDPLRYDERTDGHVERIVKLGDVVREIRARSPAELRHKVLYLWPGALTDEVLDSEFGATLTSFREDVEALAREPVTAIADDARAGEAVPVDLRSACLWAERLRRRIDALYREQNWTAEVFNEETDKIDAVFARAIEEPSRTIADFKAKGALALEDFERFTVFAGRKTDPDDNDYNVRIVHTVLRELAQLVEV